MKNELKREEKIKSELSTEKNELGLGFVVQQQLDN